MILYLKIFIKTRKNCQNYFVSAKDGLKAAVVKAKQFGKPEKTPTGEDKK